MSHFYEVIVGNVGKVYEGDNAGLARLTYDVYILKSKRGEGRVAGEAVSLWKDNEPVEEYDP